MKEFVQFVFALIFGLLCVLGEALLTGLLVMLFWNWLLVTKFGLPAITYIEGWGFATLTSLLFKSRTSSK